MKFYLFTSGVISKEQMADFWADVATYIAPLSLTHPKDDVSNGAPNGDEDAFAVYGPEKDWKDKIEELKETGKPIFTRFL